MGVYKIGIQNVLRPIPVFTPILINFIPQSYKKSVRQVKGMTLFWGY